MLDKKLLIVDGHNLLFQMFYGMPSRIINKDGKAIHAVIGFVGALKKIIKIVEPTHVVVLFDGEHENERKELLNDYKANRIDYTSIPEEDNPFSQLDDIYLALDYMKIKHIETDKYEADDVISSYIYNFSNKMKIVISSFDSDFFQLINDNVSVLRYRGKNTIICDNEYVKDKYNINANVYADFKSLVGDSADNIPGVRGVGPKTAASLINRYTNLDGILASVSYIERESLSYKLIINKELILNNYQLIKLDDRAELPFTISELIYIDNKLSTTEILTAINLK